MDVSVALMIVGGLAALVAGGEFLVRGSAQLAAILGIPSVVIGLTVVAFGTSAPELGVSLSAAFRGNADIAIANVAGSNNFNTLFILGLAALISPLVIHSTLIRREVPVMIGASVLFFILGIDGRISQLNGLLLIVVLLVYTGWLVHGALRERGELKRETDEEYTLPTGRKPSVLKQLLLIFVGLGVIALGADWLVTGAVSLARSLGVSEAVIGLTIIAAGTSLPEVVTSVVATLKGERDIAVGNIVGSNIYNILAIVGISSAVLPGGLNVAASLLWFDIPIAVAAAMLCWPVFWTGKRMSRPEGALFFMGYGVYFTYLIYNAATH